MYFSNDSFDFELSVFVVTFNTWKCTSKYVFLWLLNYHSISNDRSDWNIYFYKTHEIDQSKYFTKTQNKYLGVLFVIGKTFVHYEDGSFDKIPAERIRNWSLF